MKVLVIGDSHGNIANLKHVLGFAKHIKVKAVIHTGDWNNIKSLETVFNYNIPIYTVMGNADIDPKLIQKLKIVSESYSDNCLKIKIDGLKVCVIHNLKYLKENIKHFDIVFCGHRHRQWTNQNIVNPGDLEKDINFAVFDTVSRKVELINTLRL